jgi:hypothetical protein
MDISKIVLLVFIIKIILRLVLAILTNFNIINNKCSYFMTVNILSTILFLIFTSFGDINLIKYIFSEVCGLGMTIIIFLIKYERNINRQIRPIININPIIVANSTRSNNLYVINPDNSLSLAINK